MAAAVALNSTPEYLRGTPLWWVNRLYEALIGRMDTINTFDDYYCGNFPLPWLSPQAATEFRRVLKMSRANYIGLVVDAMCERMAVEGFLVSLLNKSDATDDPIAADQEMQRIWQANNLDTYFDQGLLEAAITGQSYLMIAPNSDDSSTPHIYVEHSSQVILAFKPGSMRREVLAGLKVWTDEWTGQIFATLYLPGSIHKYQTSGKNLTISMQMGQSFTHLQMPIWNLRSVRDSDSESVNKLGFVPLFELPNNPRLLSGGQSEIYDLMDTQDRIVKTIVDRMMTQDYGAFPQKWASGWPDTDEEGVATPPIEVGRDRMITTEVVETKFGQFTAAALDGYLEAKREDVVDMASRSRTPAQYLLGSMNNVNGDTLKASESGLVAKVRQRMRGHNDPLEMAMMRVREMAGLPAGPKVQIEVLWRNPEFRTEGELVDALLKMSDLGVPEEALWGRWGASPQEVQRWKAMLEDKMKRAAAGDATVLLADRFRQAAQPQEPAGAGAAGSQSGGQSSASARTRRPNAPKPSTT